MKRGTATSINPHLFIPPVSAVTMNRLVADLKIDMDGFVKYLNLNFSYGARRAMNQKLFNVMLHREQPIEYKDRYLYQVIFACECREVAYSDILSLTKNFIQVIDEVQKDEIYETEVI